MKNYSNYYVQKYNRKDYRDTNTYLYSNGFYKTNVKVEELPDYYIKVSINGINRYISLKTIKDIYYMPSFYTRDYRKKDRLFISYKGKIVLDDDAFPKNYDMIISGYEIDNIIYKLQEYGYDNPRMDLVKNLLDKKERWYNYWEEHNWSGDYALTSVDTWKEILSNSKTKKLTKSKKNI